MLAIRGAFARFFAESGLFLAAGLVAVADIAVASTDASFAFTETRLGILPAVVSPYVVRKIGPARATAHGAEAARPAGQADGAGRRRACGGSGAEPAGAQV